jgi:hypothetical protein
MIIGINAININSGGGIAHIKNILENLTQDFKNNNKIIIWVNPKLLNIIRECKVDKLNIEIISKKIYLSGVLWRCFFLYRELKKKNAIYFMH